jgi:hypothetical protein
MAMEETPTTEPQSDLFDLIAQAEQRHNTTPKKMRSIEECLEASMILNRMLQQGVEEGHITDDDMDYDQFRSAVQLMDSAVGEKTCKSADRHLIATYLCAMRGLPIPQPA